VIVLRPDEIVAARAALAPGGDCVAVERRPPGDAPHAWPTTREGVRQFVESYGSMPVDGGPIAWRPPTCGALLAIDPRELGHDAWLVAFCDGDHATVIGLPRAS
jgi:hypothetical protein